jgi:hypothetical protein
MTRAAFRQSEIERVIRAANKHGTPIKLNLRTLEVTVFPKGETRPILPEGTFAPDGEENWDD